MTISAAATVFETYGSPPLPPSASVGVFAKIEQRRKKKKESESDPRELVAQMEDKEGTERGHSYITFA